nr:MAG TPA: hypothetical protein [Caudoviricetes sp.]
MTTRMRRRTSTRSTDSRGGAASAPRSSNPSSGGFHGSPGH